MSLRGWLAGSVVVSVLLIIAVVFAVRESPTAGIEPGMTANGPPDSSSPAPQSAAGGSPGETLRFAIGEFCAGGESTAGGDGWGIERPDQRLEPFDEWQQGLLGRLSVSPAAEHLVLAALLDDNSVSRIDLIGRAVSANPHDAFTLWNAVHICADENHATGCPLRDWERRLLEIDSQNSESWIRVAANRFHAGDLDGALEAVQRAATSAETRAYWTETIEVAERGYAVTGDRSFPERAAMAFGVAASSLPDVGDYVKMCRAQSAASAEWAYACRAYGETLEKQARTEVGVSIGFAIQLIALEALRDSDNFADVEQRKEARTMERRVLYSENSAPIEPLMIATPALFSAYLASIRMHGEFGAQALLAEEARRLVKAGPGLACIRDHQSTD